MIIIIIIIIIITIIIITIIISSSSTSSSSSSSSSKLVVVVVILLFLIRVDLCFNRNMKPISLPRILYKLSCNECDKLWPALFKTIRFLDLE